MFFRKASPQTEGRRHTDHGIKFSPVYTAVRVSSVDTSVRAYSYVHSTSYRGERKLKLLSWCKRAAWSEYRNSAGSAL